MESVKMKKKVLFSSLQKLELSFNEKLSILLFGSVVSEFTDIELPSELKQKETKERKKSKKTKQGFWSNLGRSQQLKLFFKRMALQVVSALEFGFRYLEKPRTSSVMDNHFRT